MKDFAYSWLWNVFLLTFGAVAFSLGVKAILIHHNFILGGLYGTGLLIHYQTGLLTPALWFALFNVPLFVAGWFFVSRRFFLYSLYSVLAVTVSSELIELNFGIKEQIYAAIAAGILCGAGGGLTLRSLGSGGGLDIAAVILNRKFNLGIGKFYSIFNFVLFCFVISYYDADIFIASVILVFITSVSLEYTLALFNQRKIVYVISDRNEDIAKVVNSELKQGATLIKAVGVYSGKDKLVLMVISNNIMLKRLEEAVFNIDPQATFVVENTFDVIGSTFRKRKIY